MIVLNNSLKVQDKENLEIRFVKPWTAVFKVARKSWVSLTLLQFEQLGPVHIDDAARQWKSQKVWTSGVWPVRENIQRKMKFN